MPIIPWYDNTFAMFDEWLFNSLAILGLWTRIQSKSQLWFESWFLSLLPVGEIVPSTFSQPGIAALPASWITSASFPDTFDYRSKLLLTQKLIYKFAVNEDSTSDWTRLWLQMLYIMKRVESLLPPSCRIDQLAYASIILSSSYWYRKK